MDVGVVLDAALSPGAVRFGLLVSALEQAALGAPIDVVDLTATSPALRANAVLEGRLLVDRDPEARKLWEVQVMRVWLDLKPWLERGEALRREALLRREA